jgi:hypothetical protein
MLLHAASVWLARPPSPSMIHIELTLSLSNEHLPVLGVHFFYRDVSKKMLAVDHGDTFGRVPMAGHPQLGRRSLHGVLWRSTSSIGGVTTAADDSWACGARESRQRLLGRASLIIR